MSAVLLFGMRLQPPLHAASTLVMGPACLPLLHGDGEAMNYCTRAADVMLSHHDTQKFAVSTEVCIFNGDGDGQVSAPSSYSITAATCLGECYKKYCNARRLMCWVRLMRQCQLPLPTAYFVLLSGLHDVTALCMDCQLGDVTVWVSAG
jgi:hypothetical protein